MQTSWEYLTGRAFDTLSQVAKNHKGTLSQCGEWQGALCKVTRKLMNLEYSD